MPSNDGPASPELCAALGIDPNDLKDVLPPETPRRARGSVPNEASAFNRQTQTVQHDLLRRAQESLSEESAKTKDAVITTVATYIANKADNWWMQPVSFREKEVFFLIKMLVHTYNELEGT